MTFTLTDNAQARKTFWWLMCLHLFIWTVVAVVLQKNGPLDVLEAISWGSQWQLGYDRDPYLIAWISQAVFHLTHGHLWGIYLCSQVAVVTTFWAVWRLAHAVKLSPVYALIAVLLLECIAYYTFTSTEFNDNVLELPFWALTCLTYYHALDTQRVKYWVGFGVSLGLALMAKYYTVMLGVPILYLLLATKQGRMSFRHTGIYIAGGLFLLIVVPNIVWLAQHDFIYLTYAIDRSQATSHWISHVRYPVQFLLSQGLVLLPALAVFGLLRWRHAASSSPIGSAFDRLYIVAMGAGPLVVTLLYSLITGDKIRSMWGTPLFSLLGIVLLMVLPISLTAKKMRQFFVSVVAVFCVGVFGFSFSIVATPYMTGHAKVALFPGPQMAEQLTAQWHALFNTPLAYVAGDRSLTTRIHAYSEDHPTPYFDCSAAHSPWVNVASVRKSGALFVFSEPANRQDHGSFRACLKKHFPQAVALPMHEYAWQTAAKLSPVHIFVAVLPPQRLLKP